VTPLKVILIKPSKYAADGMVERFKTGFMPNATLFHIASLTPKHVKNVPVTVHIIDEYVRDDLDYLKLLSKDPDHITLVAVVGVQSHQFHRALDLAAYALKQGVHHCVIGGPHVMTCDTTQFQNRGISFALAEAEVVWKEILSDAIDGGLKAVYGSEQRWAPTLDGPIVQPPSPEDMTNYWSPLLGLYPVRGCPYKCDYCSVIKISGRQVRSTSVATTMESLRLAKKAGIEMIMFVSDNFNKYPDAKLLLEAMIDEQLNLRFLCQCDTQIARQPDLVELLGRANCYEIFVGVESFNREILRKAKKFHNQPDQYKEIVRLSKKAGIRTHFSNIIGFPEDNEKEILHQLNTLIELSPEVASFYILTPIPGTEQYDYYKSSGLIWEKNLDRFDATVLTWDHPFLDGGKLSDLLYYCYTEFFSASLKSKNLSEESKAFSLVSRHMAKQKIHPMGGGTGTVSLDRAKDYLSLRKDYFDIELAPLPTSLKLSDRDLAINDDIDWRATS
jgi:hypothetical protein